MFAITNYLTKLSKHINLFVRIDNLAMDFMEEFFILSCGAAAILILEEEAVSKPKWQWVRNWVRRRDEEGCCTKLLMELKLETPSLYKNFLRMSFNDVEKHRDSVECLAVTIPYLATGESFRSLQYVFRIPHNTISGIIPEMPSTKNEWEKVSKEFLKLWNFPNCFGALDGKHVVMTAPSHSGTIYYNYKRTHSIDSMAIADATYKFLYIDIGSNGRISDGGVLRKFSFNKALTSNSLNLPPPKPLPSRMLPVPHVIVADDAFALIQNIIKPFSVRNMNAMQRIFNYR